MITPRRLVTLVALMAFAACAKKQPPAAAPAPAPAPRVNQDSIDAANRARAAATAAAAEAERQRVAAAVAAETQRLAAAVAAARAKLAAAVYFDYDMDEIRADQLATLDAKVAIINANADVRIRIAGHTDDRGSDEYNLALGQRRSASIRRYLAARGVAESRFEVVSFGEQRPAQQGEDEEVRAKNRRAEFEVTAGGQNLKAP